MRKRAMTIYAENQEEYFEQLKNLKSSQHSLLNKTSVEKFHELNLTENFSTEKKEFSELSCDIFKAQENFDFLSPTENFKLRIKEKTYEELEKIQEQKLIDTLDNINQSYKYQNKKEFLMAISDLSSTCQLTNAYSEISFMNEDNVCPEHKKIYLSKSERKTTRTNSNSFQSHEMDSVEINYLKQILNGKVIHDGLRYASSRYLNKFDKLNNNNYNDYNDSTTTSSDRQIKCDNSNLKLLNAFENFTKNKRPSVESNLSLYSNSQSFTNLSMFSNESISPVYGNKTKFDLNSNSNTNHLENILSQNLNLTEDTVKLIIIGDKAVGKSFFIKNLFKSATTVLNSNNTENSSIYFPNYSNPYYNTYYNYIPTPSLEIKRILINLLNKIIRLELWDTNVNIINSNIIKTYYKLCNGIIMICDVASIESIKFLEKQIEILIASINNPNFFLIVNLKNDIDINDYHYNMKFLGYLNEKYMIKPAFVNFSEYNFKNDFLLQRFINNCLIKKGKRHSKRMNLNISSNGKNLNARPHKNENDRKNILEEDNKNDNNHIGHVLKSSHLKSVENKLLTYRDMSASPRNSNREKCYIF